jgi:hypothetical protein
MGEISGVAAPTGSDGLGWARVGSGRGTSERHY